MKTKRYLCLVTFLWLCAHSGMAYPGFNLRDSLSAEQVVSHLYDLVTFPKGTSPDWSAVRALFLDEAIIVLRTSKAGNTVFTLDGFVDDFVRFIDDFNTTETGFQEKVVKMVPMVMGDIAHVLVLYEASIPGRDRPPTRGVDSFHLVWKDGQWRIVSIVNELTGPACPLPAELTR